MIAYSFIIPLHNEEKILLSQIAKLVKFIDESNFNSYEILLVENGSRDKTYSLAKLIARKHSQIRVLQILGASYGRAVKHGFCSSVGKKIFVLDVDFIETDFIKDAANLLNRYHIVLGSKNLPFSYYTRPYIGQFRTAALNMILVAFFGFTGTDTHGIRAFLRTENFKETIFECICKNEFFDTELLLRLVKKGDSLHEIPVSIREIRESRYPSIRRAKLILIDIYRLVSFTLFGGIRTFKEVSADDYGLTSITSRAILNEYKAGCITHISILANLVSTKAISHLLECKGLFALHCNLVRGRPIAPTHQVLSLIEKNGNFYKLPEFILRLLLRKINRTEIRREILFQLYFLKRRNIKIGFIDSEQHTHVLQPINHIINEIATNENLVVRSNKSTLSYLQPRFPKFFIIVSLEFLLSLMYKYTTNVHPKAIDTLITHPGSNFD